MAQVQPDGTIKALAPGDITIQAEVPGIAADKGFLFIEKLGQIGVTGEDGEIHWDILGMILFFGVSLYVSQQITQGGSPAGDEQQQQQQAIAKFTPIIFSGMFLFFPLPAGVLMYMVIANMFQTAQSFILSKEPLPENLQKLVDAQEAKKAKSGKSGDADRGPLAFEPGAPRKSAAPKNAGNKNSGKGSAKGGKAKSKAKTAARANASKKKTGSSKGGRKSSTGKKKT